MTTCRNCKIELTPDDSFCGQCGQVVFADENLEAAVREALEKPEEPLITYDLKSLTQLSDESREIEDLSGLQHATNLTKLTLWDNQLGDVSPLALLTNLFMLNLRGNPLDLNDIQALRNIGVIVKIDD